MKALRTLLVAVVVVVPNAAAQEMPPEYQGVLTTLGKKGDFKAGVLRVNIPRTDLDVAVDDVATPTQFGFGGWLALTKGEGGHEVLMGDLVLLEDEVNPVMSAVLDHGLEVTALHNHFFWEEPRIYYMHVMGSGTAAELAHRAKPAVDLIGTIQPRRGGKASTRKQPAPPGKLDTAKIARIVGHEGEQNGPVYKITVGRDDLDVREHGARINARMGLNTWASFVGSDARAAIAGDVAMLENEVTPVLKTLRRNGLDVVAIHHHMTGSRPVVIFLHYWGKGPAEKLATGFRAALAELGRHGKPSQR